MERGSEFVWMRRRQWKARKVRGVDMYKYELKDDRWDVLSGDSFLLRFASGGLPVVTNLTLL